MPTVLRNGPHRFFFYSADQEEPPHVHVQRDDFHAKFWLNPIRLVTSAGFSRKELRDIESKIAENHEQLLRAWNDYFSD